MRIAIRNSDAAQFPLSAVSSVESSMRSGATEPGIPTDNVHPLLQLQRFIGNRGVGRTIQTKLKVSQPQDKYEREAERVARQVVTPSSSAARPVVKERLHDDGVIHIMRVPTESGIRESPPRYCYSTHCGWIDWEHAQSHVPQGLIRAVRAASRRLRDARGTGGGGAGGAGHLTGPAMESRVQDVLLSGVTPTANIRRPLTPDEELSVALKIFMLQSLGFEALQAWTQLVGRSSFSEEDLPSNIIAFYMAARNFDRTQIENICGVWNEADSLRMFQGYQFRQNRTFRPLSLPPGGSWPARLADIAPAAADGPLLDMPEGEFETLTAPRRRRSFRDIELIHSGRLRIDRIGGSGPVDISNEESSSAAAPHFEVRPLPARHDFEFRWIISDSRDRSYLMWGDEGQVFQYGSQFNAYIGSRTRALLKSRNIRSATVKCRIITGRGSGGAMEQLLTLPVAFTW